MKQRIKLTESQLYKIIQETINEVLSETLFDLPQHLTKKTEMNMDFKELEDSTNPNKGRTPEGWSNQNNNVTNSWDINGGSYSPYELKQKQQQMDKLWDEHELDESINESYNQYGVWDLVDTLKKVMSAEDILSIEGPEYDEEE